MGKAVFPLGQQIDLCLMWISSRLGIRVIKPGGRLKEDVVKGLTAVLLDVYILLGRLDSLFPYWHDVSPVFPF